MGAAVNQIAVSKVMLCFTLASHISHRAWHLSGCRSEAQHPMPVTQTTRSLSRWRGWLVSCLSRNEVIPFCEVYFFNKVKQNNLKGKHCVEVFMSDSLSCKLGYRLSWIHATGFRVKNDIYVCYIYGPNKFNINKPYISIGALQFYWVWQHCQNTTGAASSNNTEVSNKLSSELLLYRDPTEEQ